MAPDFSLPQVISPDGTPADSPLSLSKLPGQYRLLYCFQSWCPGCHSAGFPALTEIVEAMADRPEKLSCAVIQTVFEGFGENSYEALVKTRERYPLKIPFAHDSGDGEGSAMMKAYRSGGTPWFILIGPDGRVLFNDFKISAEGLIKGLSLDKKSEASQLNT